MNSNIKRPKRIDQENEDDLLAFQEEFLKGKSQDQPAAKVIRMNSTSSSAQKETNGREKASSNYDCKF